MAKQNWKGNYKDDDGDGGGNSKPRIIKYFITFEGVMIQPGNIERVDQTETANEQSLGGEDDCLLFNLILRMKDYPFVLTFPFFTEESRADALVLLQSQMVDNRISIQ